MNNKPFTLAAGTLLTRAFPYISAQAVELFHQSDSDQSVISSSCGHIKATVGSCLHPQLSTLSSSTTDSIPTSQLTVHEPDSVLVRQQLGGQRINCFPDTEQDTLATSVSVTNRSVNTINQISHSHCADRAQSDSDIIDRCSFSDCL